MSKTLIITEKPSVAREYAKILKVNGPRAEGLIENEQYVITWCVGHLVEMLYPDAYDSRFKKWTLEDLPFLPRDYKYDVIANVKRQYEIVNHNLHREDIDTVLWAGDSGKEGQVIEENLRRFGGVREGMTEKRVWIDSCTEEEILRGIREAKPMSEYDNLANSGIMRSIEDYAVGINFSRAMSVRYGNMLNQATGTEKYTAIAIGRVMTCVLGMVVKREREIRNFKETAFYKVSGDFSDFHVNAEWKVNENSPYFGTPKLYKENGFVNKADAIQFIDSLQGKEAVLKKLEQSTQNSKAPLLFNLAELQAECAKRYKISPDQTLQVAQNLYEKKLTTYPRTDARVLSTAIAKEISKNLYGLKKYSPTAKFTDTIINQGLYKNIAHTQYTDDKKVTDHYCIIPTGNLSEYDSLTELEKSVYDMITRRFLSIFYPPATYLKTTMVVGVGAEEFFASTKSLKNPGYLEIAGRDRQKGNDEEGNKEGEADAGAALVTLAAALQEGDMVTVNGYSLKEGKTQPPKRYTSGSMVLAMENAGQLIEDEELRAQIKGSGIGTSATRAEIIAKLINIGYLSLNKKTQVLAPEKFGEMVYEIVDMTVPALLEPKMTASWEKGLDGITNGTVNMEEYRAKLEAYIERETNHIKEHDLTGILAEKIEPFAEHDFDVIVEKHRIGAKCPFCGGEIETTPFGYGCENYHTEQGCKFSIGKIAGKRLSESTVVKLVTEGKTDVLTGFTSKTGVPFKAALRLKDENGVKSIAFDFSEVQPDVVEQLTCPGCGGHIVRTGYGFACENRNRDGSGCYFSVGKIAGKDISEKEIQALLTNGKTEILKGFKSKSGKKFQAALKLEQNEEGIYSIAFDFEDVEPEKLEGVVCPNCGGEILVTQAGFGCSNYKKEGEGCSFFIGKIAGKAISKADAIALLKDGKTGVIKGFKSKNKKSFSAGLLLKTDETGKKVIVFDFENENIGVIQGVKCPVCNGAIQKTSFGYGCRNYAKDGSGCNFSIGTVGGKKLSEAIVKKLLTEKQTDTIEGFQSKSGKKFAAALGLEEALDANGRPTKKITYVFPDRPKPVESNLICPKCLKKLMKNEWNYSCECGYKIRFTIAQRVLSEEEIAEMMKNGRSAALDGFISKTGSTFQAVLRLEEDGNIVFDFEALKENQERHEE